MEQLKMKELSRKVWECWEKNLDEKTLSEIIEIPEELETEEEIFEYLVSQMLMKWHDKTEEEIINEAREFTSQILAMNAGIL